MLGEVVNIKQRFSVLGVTLRDAAKHSALRGGGEGV